MDNKLLVTRTRSAYIGNYSLIEHDRNRMKIEDLIDLKMEYKQCQIKYGGILKKQMTQTK